MTDGAGIRRVAVCTGGGDAPGLNAVIRAVTLAAANRGWSCAGIRDGYDGLLFPERFPQGGLVALDRERVRGITHLGGTILGSTNRNNPLRFPATAPDGQPTTCDRTDELLAALRAQQIDALVAIGGDGSMEIAHVLSAKGLRVVGVPKTIDNDLERTVVTFGFDSAVAFATECVDRLHTTAASHQRIIVVEVMGRYAGWIALRTGVSANAHVVLLPEIAYDLSKVAAVVRERERLGRRATIVVVAEGAREVGGDLVVREHVLGRAERLGGVGERVAAELATRTGREARTVVLGHLLRGGPPTTFDRLIALRFGAAAVRALAAGRHGVMVALAPPTVDYVPLADATRRMKTVPLDCDTMQTARDLGICFGD